MTMNQAKPRRRQKSFIGSDLAYTNAPSVAAPKPMSLESSEQPSLAVETTTEAETVVGDRPPRASARRDCEQAVVGDAPGGDAARSVEFSFVVRPGPQTLALIDDLAERDGRPREVIMRFLRDGAIEAFRSDLGREGGRAAQGATEQASGPGVQVRLRLTGRRLDVARARFDPLGFGRTALNEGVRGAVTDAYRARVRAVAARVGLAAAAEPEAPV